MALTARNTRLAALVIATAVAGSLAPGAAASSDTLNVNPSTGYATPAPSPRETVQVNPSTGYASVGQPSTTPLAATPRSIEPPPPPNRHPDSTGPRPGSAPRPAEDSCWC